MAEAVLEVVLDNLSSLVQKEIGLFLSFEQDFKSLSSLLTTIKATLEDAEEKQFTDKAIKDWLIKLKDAAYILDDILDECATQALEMEYKGFKGGPSHKVQSSFLSSFHPKHVAFRYKLAKKMKRIRERLDEIAEERSKFHLTEIVRERRSGVLDWRQTTSNITQPQVYGRNEDKNRIVDFLVDDAYACEDLSVYPIVGLGGLGKTTLAQVVFNYEKVVEHFELRIWVCVSEDFSLKRMTKAIIEAASGHACEDLDLEPLQRKLLDLLRRKRYLLVLDDVWDDEQENWQKLRSVLACGGKGASVLVTTRLSKVAAIMGTMPSHDLSMLSDTDCWELIKQRAFGPNEEERPDLVIIGKEIVKKCGGVPLAAKALGSLLRFKRQEKEWRYVKESKLWSLQGENSVMPALRLSYLNLPVKLRQCFAFCALFPKDGIISKQFLIELWMANGFISSNEILEAQDIGSEVWNELHCRSFFQDTVTNEFGQIVCFKMHDLVHDLAQSIAEEICHITNDSGVPSLSERVRHLSIYRWNKLKEVGSIRLHCVESLKTCINHVDQLSPHVLRCYSLRVLDFERKEKLSSSIGRLKYLRYLNLSRGNFKTLPESLCTLWNLQILKLNNCQKLQKLPNSLVHLKALQHLYLRDCYSLSSLPPHVRMLASLKTLTLFVVGIKKGYLLAELGQMNLQGDLHIKHLERVKSVMNAKEANMSSKCVDNLKLSWDRNEESQLQEKVEEILEVLQPQTQQLRSLGVRGYTGSCFPEWISSPTLKYLTSLQLVNCKSCLHLPHLGKLPSLKSLTVFNMSHVKYLDEESCDDGVAGGFICLEKLDLVKLPNLIILSRDDRENMLPHLSQLQIIECPKLLALPCLPSLIDMRISGKCNTGLLSSIQKLVSLESLMFSGNEELTCFPDGMLRNLNSPHMAAFTVGEGEASSSSCSSSSSSTTRLCSYHVFLSFRGEDTRKGFTDHLCAALERKGITTFRDDKDLERGQVISQKLIHGIQDSMFAITVLSPDYASSTWCLDELQMIMECSNNKGLEVLPVFYGVDPSDVRHQRGCFEDAFRKHQDKFGQHMSDKVDRWRDALTQVASYSGWDSKGQQEALLVESIAQHIHRKLVPKLPSRTENLVGIESKVEEVNKLVGMGLNDIRFIGIWGMGGIGKTTIARAVYEAIQCEFQLTCFLANVRELSETNGLVHIQRQLLSHLSISRNDFHDLYDGKKTIQNSLCRKKVLLVLDDVNELNQLENLAGKQDWFGPGSRVIITTRDKHLLLTHEVHKTYEVGMLFQNEALNLFCLKAFKGDQPQEGYLDLSKEVVNYSGGLPLALDVLGSYLYGRNVDVWHSAIKKIRSALLQKIQDKLKISYESLDATEKSIFLDIACFFKGMKRDKVINILENCGYHPEITIQVLIDRSLITLDRVNNKLGMHDLLQEMGRNIVLEESPNDPGRRSRLWSKEDIDRVLTKNKGTKKISSVVLNSLQPYEARWSIEAFSKATQIKLLSLNEVHLPLGLSCLPCSLKVLRWKGCPLKTLAQTNQLDEIVDIKLSHSQLEQLWQGKNFMENLKYLNLKFSKNLKRLPDFSGVPNLEKLILKGCVSLTEVHPSLVHHNKVVLVNFEDCTSLEALPEKLEMSSLKELILSGCCEFKFLPEFGESMENLSMLALQGTALRNLTSSLGRLVGLTDLNLKDCKSLVCLPDTIHGLNSLRVLDISGCSKLCRLPDGLKEIKCLEELHANDTSIDELYRLPDSLKVLSFAGCKGTLAKSMNRFIPFNRMRASQPAPTGFRFPHSAWNLPSLKHLNLSYCDLSEESIPHYFRQLTSLVSLDLTGNNFVTIPSSISELSKLELLTLNCCEKLQLLPELPSSIMQLDASNCDSLETPKFDPAKPCSLFASPIQLSLPREFKSFMEGRCLPTTRFDMLIPGDEIPSWFVPQRSVSWAKVHIPNNFPQDEWVGFALCFLLVSYAVPPELCNHEIDCYLFSPNGKQLISTRKLPPMDPCYPHLYILYLSIEQFRDKILEDDYWDDVEFSLKCYCCHSLQIVSSGCRLVCKQDVEVFRDQIVVSP